MATYAIGDIQGCYDDLQRLLESIKFEPQKDKLWIAGDLVNRGPQSLLTLRFIKSLGNRVKVVLGNHDLTLLAMSAGYGSDKKHTMDDILNAPDLDELMLWLRQQKLIHYSKKRNFVMVHAGIYPLWTLKQALIYASEVETILKSSNYRDFFANMFGNNPAKWDDSLSGWDRLRFITNSMTRMRYCTANGQLDFKFKGPVGSQDKKHIPWFKLTTRKNKHERIIFGHWSTLLGQTKTPNTYALDTGCLWGGSLTAMKVPKKNNKTVIYEYPCKNNN